MQLGILGVKQTWKSLITANGRAETQICFVDEGVELPSPLKTWKHHHIIEKVINRQSLIVEDIQFSTDFKLLELLLYPVLYLQFWYRKPIYKQYFQ